MNPRIGLSRRNFVTGAAARIIPLDPVIATPRISAAAAPTIRVQPDNGLQDIPLGIRLSGFSPRQPVMVTAEMVCANALPKYSRGILTRPRGRPGRPK
jgi:hypothetical protein